MAMPGVLVSVVTYDSGQILKKVTVQRGAKLKIRTLEIGLF